MLFTNFIWKGAKYCKFNSDTYWEQLNLCVFTSDTNCLNTG